MENGHKWSWKVMENHFQCSVCTLFIDDSCGDDDADDCDDDECNNSDDDDDDDDDDASADAAVSLSWWYMSVFVLTACQCRACC